MKMIRLPRSNWMLVLLMVLVAALGVATLRAAAQSIMTGPRSPQVEAAAAPADESKPPSNQAKPPSDQTQAPAKEPKSTTAPDIRGSADNNVSFPVDI